MSFLSVYKKKYIWCSAGLFRPSPGVQKYVWLDQRIAILEIGLENEVL